jgi:hypothetical protein
MSSRSSAFVTQDRRGATLQMCGFYIRKGPIAGVAERPSLPRLPAAQRRPRSISNQARGTCLNPRGVASFRTRYLPRFLAPTYVRATTRNATPLRCYRTSRSSSLPIARAGSSLLTVSRTKIGPPSRLTHIVNLKFLTYLTQI